MPRKPRSAYHVHLSSHEKALMAFYRILPEELRQTVDAALSRAYWQHQSSLPSVEQKTKVFGRAFSGLKADSVDALTLAHFINLARPAEAAGGAR